MIDIDTKINDRLNNIKLDNVQLDPNGFCNNTCWFCPVAYMPNPTSHTKQMSVDSLYKIIKNCDDERGKLFVHNFNHFWTAHYNEILLYKFLEDFFKILRDFKFKTTVLSNGINLTQDKLDIMSKYDDVISAICLNVPAATLDAYKRYTGKNEATYNLVMKNIDTTMKVFPKRVENKSLNLMINGVDDDHKDQRQDFLGQNAPFIPFYDLHFQEQEMKKKFNGLHIYRIGGLSDRASHLSKYGIFKHPKIWAKRDEVVTGCLANRMHSWLHINPLGNAFLCCNDYSFEYEFGNVIEKDIKTVWFSDEHKKLIKRALNGICRTCGAAEKEK